MTKIDIYSGFLGAGKTTLYKYERKFNLTIFTFPLSLIKIKEKGMKKERK